MLSSSGCTIWIVGIELKRFLRRIRGIFFLGLLWALGWGVAFLGLGLLFGSAGVGLPFVAAMGMFYGFVGGVSFALILSSLNAAVLSLSCHFGGLLCGGLLGASGCSFP